MLLQPAWFFEHFLSKKQDQNNKVINGLIMGVFILVLLLTVMNFALASMGDQSEFEDDDLGFLDLSAVNPFLAHFFFAALVLGIELGNIPMRLRSEYLKSHIGEKRPASERIQTNNSSFRLLFPWTALFLCRPFICSIPRLVL